MNTNNEILAIYSEEGELTGSKTRREVHTEPLLYWHGVTQIWIFNKNQEMLCSKRSDTVEGNPSKWQTYVGGHVKAGNTFEDTAIQEVDEEIGLKVDKERLVFIDDSRYEPAKHISKTYLVLFDPAKDIISFNDGEVSEIKWINLDSYSEAVSRNPQEWCNTLSDKKREKIVNIINNLIERK